MTTNPKVPYFDDIKREKESYVIITSSIYSIQFTPVLQGFASNTPLLSKCFPLSLRALFTTHARGGGEMDKDLLLLGVPLQNIYTKVLQHRAVAVISLSSGKRTPINSSNRVNAR